MIFFITFCLLQAFFILQVQSDGERLMEIPTHHLTGWCANRCKPDHEALKIRKRYDEYVCIGVKRDNSLAQFFNECIMEAYKVCEQEYMDFKHLSELVLLSHRINAHNQLNIIFRIART